jgi:hypothetical protein
VSETLRCIAIGEYSDGLLDRLEMRLCCVAAVSFLLSQVSMSIREGTLEEAWRRGVTTKRDDFEETLMQEDAESQ